MKIKYDKESNTIVVVFREDRIKESDEIRPNVIADFGYDGRIVRLEILDARGVIENPSEFSFSVEENRTA